MVVCKSISEWIEKAEGQKFRYWVYKKIFTPLEQEKKYADQSEFEDIYAKIGVIRECVLLPWGDLLIGFEDNEKDFVHSISYFKLSEIRLEWYECDQNDEEDFEEEEE